MLQDARSHRVHRLGSEWAMKIGATSHPLLMVVGGKHSSLKMPKAFVLEIPAIQTNRSQGDNIKFGI